ncbi:acetyl-CoA carboxylase biotin carboxyl carrier protein [Roseofilum sp. BLCC_M154]|uniref:Biotin carboxyl carrier protein of acetyl-CoA carboxylase n=1 Tax=Roseofilum acuticapitatum BLCC-M154 TaxID=3022444 RepID=A0ABT7AW13_9CYAN|nr:acetyl-CoA carboxylase biotin carboxyl carrier protein [Roseofilum acuticapitatum]MDJ1170752.1 acetyl-CoA carboxylase biotin carboxyl carrier protein [Roseofilum acuticapitatum BLCC-M154]
MNLNFDELRELLTTLSQTDIAELTLKSDAFELTVRKGETGAIASVSHVAVSSPVVQSPVPTPTQLAPPTPPVSEPSPPPLEQKLEEIKSPMVGTFYRAPAPDEPPFTEVGARIRVGDTVCIIEAMKLMNELEAEVSGEVVEILVDNAQPVEFGQVLMRVKPN